MNASTAQWMHRTGTAPGTSWRVSQGARLGRAGDITVTVDDSGAVWVGGVTTTLFTGTALA